MTRVCAGIVALAVGLQAGSLRGEPARRDPVADAIAYAKLVEEYRHGDSAGAIRTLITGKPEVILRAIPEVRKAAANPAGANVPIRAILAALPAAVMLHTEAGLYLNSNGEGARAWSQWTPAQILAEVDPNTREQSDFLRAWYRALGSFFLGSYLARDAVALLERGLQRFPDDMAIALALGQACEARGTFAEGQILSARPHLSSDARNDLLTAEHLYRNLLARDPSLAEARLHLGRVLDIDGRSDAALRELRQLGAASVEARLRYMGHLFAGDLLRRQARLADARDDFALAVEAWPGGQAASLGLAEALQSLGEPEAASALMAALEDREPVRPDPFRSYHFGDRVEQKRRLEAVKAMARVGGTMP